MADEALCPLCLEELDLTERKFKPCPCGYQMCRFCWHQICEEGDSKCPNCRQPYTRGHINLTPLTADQMAKMKEARKSKDKSKKAQGPASQALARRNLSNVRVVQRNLVYVTNVPLNIAREDLLRRQEYFGQYGRISKIVVNRANVHLNPSAPGGGTTSLYVTYVREEDALAVIHAVDGSTVEGRVLRASFGTTKYCAQFLRGASCTNPDCMYLHRLGQERDSFTKDDLSVGKYAHDVALQSRPVGAPPTRAVPGVLPAPVPHSSAPALASAPAPPTRSTLTNSAPPSAVNTATSSLASSTGASTAPVSQGSKALVPKQAMAGAWAKQPVAIAAKPVPATLSTTPAPQSNTASSSSASSARSSAGASAPVPSSSTSSTPATTATNTHSSAQSAQRKVKAAAAPQSSGPVAPTSASASVSFSALPPPAANKSTKTSVSAPTSTPAVPPVPTPPAASSSASNSHAKSNAPSTIPASTSAATATNIARSAVPPPSGAGASGGKRSTLSSSVVSESLWYNVLQEEEEEREKDEEEAEEDEEVVVEYELEAEAEADADAGEDVQEAEEAQPDTAGDDACDEPEESQLPADEEEEEGEEGVEAPSTITDLLDDHPPVPKPLASATARAAPARMPLSPAEALVESFRALLPNVNVSVGAQAARAPHEPPKGWEQQQGAQRVYAPLLYPYGGTGLWAAPAVPMSYAPPHFTDPAIMGAARAPSREPPLWYTQAPPPHYAMHAPPPHHAHPHSHPHAHPHAPYQPAFMTTTPPPGFAPRPPLQDTRAAPLLLPQEPMHGNGNAGNAHVAHESASRSDSTEPDEEDHRTRRRAPRKGK